MKYQTNTVVEHHNIWTFTKHVAGSVNKAAAKTDALVYGTKTNIVVTPVPEQHPVRDTFVGIGFGILLLGLFIAYCAGAVKGRDFITF